MELIATALVLGLVGIAAFLWSRERPVMSRFVITVEVETPEGIRTGSSVVTAGYRGAGISSGGNRTVPRFSGEAVAIQLPGKPTLFALVGENESGYGMSQLIVSAFGGSNQFKAASIGEEGDPRRDAALPEQCGGERGPVPAGADHAHVRRPRHVQRSRIDGGQDSPARFRVVERRDARVEEEVVHGLARVDA